jgi:hypothetical protein
VRPKQSCTANQTASRIAAGSSTIVEERCRGMLSVIGKIA